MTRQQKYPPQKGFDMKKVLKIISIWLTFLLTGKGEIADEAVDEGLIDYGGQGRDKYGR